ncbi:hypothetical protein V1511DRAFT_506371 [Dipodascopsis uninucleata]
MVYSVICQGHISPWSSRMRTTYSEFEHVLSMSPLPTTLAIVDSTASVYRETYAGCHVMNPSRFIWPDQRRAMWLEYSLSSRKSIAKSCAF